MKRLAIILLALGLTACVTQPVAYVAPPRGEIVYEPDVIVGKYHVGYYREGFGYWTGRGWDADFYTTGHPGWGHYYRGAPGHAWGPYYKGRYYRR